MGQMIAHGASPVVVSGGFDEALAATRSVAEELGLALVNSVNPHRLEGQKTAAFEICDHLKGSPDVVVVPVGNAGNITAYGRGFTEYRARGLCPGTPRLIGIQAAGAAPLVDGRPVHAPSTIASAIRIGNPASWSGAVESVRTSSGRFMKVTDDDIRSAQRDLAVDEGILVEPASAAAVAGLRRICQEEGLTGQTIVCVLTGHGLKDPNQLPRTRETLPEAIPASPDSLIGTVERLLRALG
jgi:threonine synthase